jgi:hypothetical protein
MLRQRIITPSREVYWRRIITRYLSSIAISWIASQLQLSVNGLVSLLLPQDQQIWIVG